MYSGILRLYQLRYRLHKDCTARPESCSFVNWTSDAASFPKVGAQAALAAGPAAEPSSTHSAWQALLLHMAGPPNARDSTRAAGVQGPVQRSRASSATWRPELTPGLAVPPCR
jgi:hypothetical protein